MLPLEFDLWFPMLERGHGSRKGHSSVFNKEDKPSRHTDCVVPVCRGNHFEGRASNIATWQEAVRYVHSR